MGEKRFRSGDIVIDLDFSIVEDNYIYDYLFDEGNEYTGKVYFSSGITITPGMECTLNDVELELYSDIFREEGVLNATVSKKT